MSTQVAMLRDELREVVRALDPERLDGRDAAGLVAVYAAIEHLGGAGKMLAARRVQSTGTWSREGDRSFEAWLARVGGTGLGEAMRVAETAARLEELPATEAGLRDGRLSRVQVDEVAGAAAADPEAEQTLLHTAESRTVKALKERGKQIKAAARRDEADRYARIRADRHVRTWEDHDGAHLHLQSTADAVAVVKSAIEAYESAIFNAARRAGEPESHGAYRADARVAIARDALTGTPTHVEKRLPRAEMRIRMDFAAFRGHTESGEVCEIPGIGPMPVEAARALVPDAIIDLVITQGTDVRAIVTHSRKVRRAVQVALEERYPTCAKWDCDVASHLERDHVHDFAKTKHTRYEELVPWCEYHHDLKTYRGYTPVQLDDGAWDLKPPDADSADDRAPPDTVVA